MLSFRWEVNRKVPNQAYSWDFFLAHAAADGPAAKELFDLLSPSCRVFLDSECLLPGDDWDLILRRAQCSSRITVVLLSRRSEKSYYQREEIAAAIAMARDDNARHRVVPVYLDDREFENDVPYGLRLKHSLSVNRCGGMLGIAERLQSLLEHSGRDGTATVSQLPSASPTEFVRPIDRKKMWAALVIALSAVIVLLTPTLHLKPAPPTNLQVFVPLDLPADVSVYIVSEATPCTLKNARQLPNRMLKKSEGVVTFKTKMRLYV
jgi:hypothetical protein